MEPEHTPLEKEKHLQFSLIFGFQPFVFGDETHFCCYFSARVSLKLPQHWPLKRGAKGGVFFVNHQAINVEQFPQVFDGKEWD